jgi:HK97 family phage major capsid protein
MSIQAEKKTVEQLENDTKVIEDRIKAVEDRQKAMEHDTENDIARGGYMRTGGRSDSDESRALKYFGVGHVKQLLEVNTGDARFAQVPGELKFLVKELKRDFDICRLTQQILHGETRDAGEAPAHVKGILDGSNYARNVLAPKLKAFGSTVAGAGDEWVPTAVSAQFIEEYELERNVSGQVRLINMPTNPYDITKQVGTTKARRQVEGQGLAGNNFGTGKIQFDAIKSTEFYPLTEELNEDSAPDILTLARSEVVEAQIRAHEAAMVNGDTTGTHMDNDFAGQGSEIAEKFWKGFVKLALENSANGGTVTFGGAAVSTALARSMRTAMGKFGVNPRELVWLVSPKTYQEFKNLDEVTSVEKFGPMATILRGALDAFDGIPIVISEYMRDDVAATGVNTVGGPNNRSRIVLVNHRRFYMGQRRPIRVKAVMDPTPPADGWLIASWWRGDFKGHVQSATEVSSVLGYNIA